MDDFKVLLVGPTGAGKTTAISTVSDISVISTEVTRSSLDTESLNSQLIPKSTVTVGIDYGELSLNNSMRIRLYGVPGQVRFESLWGLIHEGSVGTVILFDISSNDYSEEFVFFVNRFHKTLLTERCIIGISKYSEIYSSRVTELLELLNHSGVNVPVFSVDVRNKEDVLKLLFMLIE
ncbi:ATP/GTP-binding protein [Klebsiella sp. RHBSTW-00484]|uniref:GTP-binding protein n=1 Tax=unclassified Klebsiella TaxID=2608929 RepID=UPI0015E50389|nr:MULTISPECIES: ATP/GTP-binding protein [unclassified Klebsiella]MBA7848237.1 ATP/GTP-binding protein [Klebsiella sp. RHBSTW-00465]QLO35967.1 ATP/GTP-binding protein [Klebsiella sp. RHBSTW-00484]QLT75483.1 ATP/GTP-binding protein [Klebsiella sp. RHBSTW-00464]